MFCKTIMDHSRNSSKTLLHLGCGAGINDWTFKRHFNVTGIDISKGMLKIAQNLNPEVTYVHGDMRTIKLPEQYDAVAIPDSIGYMATFDDLKKTVLTSCDYLKKGGVLLIVAQMPDDFKENNFVYTGKKGDIDITLFENNHFLSSKKDKYEALFTYLIRRKGKLKIVNDSHVIRLFPLETWISLFKDAGLEIAKIKINTLYDRFIMDQGEYALKLFVCVKPDSSGK